MLIARLNADDIVLKNQVLRGRMLGLNWKTNLFSLLTGLATLLLGIPTFITAIQAWGNHQPVDWRSVLVTTALALVTAGLASAKDASNQSTPAQVQAAGAVVAAQTPDQVDAAKAQLKAANEDAAAGLKK